MNLKGCVMKRKAILTASVLTLAGLAGCAVHDTPKQGPKGHSVDSRQVAIMPYATQGVDVEGSSTWFYGQNNGIRAYPTMGGIRYIDDAELDEIRRQQMARVRLKEAEARAAEAEMQLLDAQKKVDAKQVVETTKNVGAKRSEGLPFLNSNKGFVVNNGLPENIRAELKGLDRLASVSFLFDKHDVMYEYSKNVMSRFLKSNPKGGKFVVIGYTDDVGLDDINIPLSEKRARFVAGIIKENFPNAEVVAHGQGPYPRAKDNRAKRGRPANRRVEIYGSK